MSDIALKKKAGETLRKSIKENYTTQEEFAYDYGLEIRTVSRYINEGIKDSDKVEELAKFFNVPWFYFYGIES